MARIHPQHQARYHRPPRFCQQIRAALGRPCDGQGKWIRFGVGQVYGQGFGKNQRHRPLPRARPTRQNRQRHRPATRIPPAGAYLAANHADGLPTQRGQCATAQRIQPFQTPKPNQSGVKPFLRNRVVQVCTDLGDPVPPMNLLGKDRYQTALPM